MSKMQVLIFSRENDNRKKKEQHAVDIFFRVQPLNKEGGSLYLYDYSKDCGLA